MSTRRDAYGKIGLECAQKKGGHPLGRLFRTGLAISPPGSGILFDAEREAAYNRRGVRQRGAGGSRMTVKKIPAGCLVPSAALTIKRARWYALLDKPPQAGDAVYGKVVRLGQHSTLENRSGRIHAMNDGTRAIFVYGNRYAPDHYEGIVPDGPRSEVDMLARSGVVGEVRVKNSAIKDPTRVRVLGHVCREDGTPVSTLDSPLISPRRADKGGRRSKLILVVGTSMNSGKSMAAAACCWALSSMGHEVRASKVTGTASLKDILLMNDCGASRHTDFTHFGHPSTYMLPEAELLRVFNQTDLAYANNPKNYWVVELADGILQRETAMLLSHEDVRSRIHRLVFCSADALGCLGGIGVLRSRFGLSPDALSGVVSSSPLAARELAGAGVEVPMFDSLLRSLNLMSEILI